MDAGSSATEVIAQRLDELTDLFRRRLLQDRAQARAVEALRAQVDDLRLAPLCRELILLLDRIDASEDDFARSLGEELEEILAHYGLERIPTTPSFDPAIQRVVSTRPKTGAKEGAVLEVVREGYALNGSVLRPQHVIVASGPREVPS
nr:nucleotide exchange factor GrpE [Thermophilibacter gallinarum]